MSGKQSDAVTKAVRAVRRPKMPLTAYRAAKRYGIALSTIYRALKRTPLPP